MSIVKVIKGLLGPADGNACFLNLSGMYIYTHFAVLDKVRMRQNTAVDGSGSTGYSMQYAVCVTIFVIKISSASLSLSLSLFLSVCPLGEQARIMRVCIGREIKRSL